MGLNVPLDFYRMHENNVKHLSNSYAFPLQSKYKAKCVVQNIECKYLFDVSWILGCLSFLHSLTWHVCQVIAMSCEVVILVVQLDVCFLSIVVYKEAFWFFIANYFASCYNASSCFAFPICWNISKIMVWRAMTFEQYDKFNSTIYNLKNLSEHG